MFNEDTAYYRLRGKTVLLFIKKSFTLTEAEVVEITQHRIRVKVLQKNNTVPVGVKKSDVVILPISTPRKKLNFLIKQAIDSDNSLQSYLDEHAFKLS